MWNIFHQRRGLTRLILIVLILIACNTIIFTAFLVSLFSEVSVGAMQQPILHRFYILLIFFAAAFAGIYIFAYYKIINPLRKSEKMIFESFDKMLKDKGISIPSDNLKTEKVIETVITHQKDSWHRELTANLLRQKAELAQLQSQINPHFLYNTLESIRGFALMKKVPEIAEMTQALSLLFRNNTRKIGMLVTLSDEILSVENYIFIQKFRFQNKFTFDKKINDENKGILNFKIPNFIIQPIIENAIYHGLETTIEKGEILLNAYATQSRLILQVNDNGCGIPSDKLEKLIYEINSPHSYDLKENTDDTHTGIGLVNINRRIKMQFGSQYGITIASTVNIGTQVEITLPYEL